MPKHWENFLFGLFFGMGFCIAYAVLMFIASFLAKATPPLGQRVSADRPVAVACSGTGTQSWLQKGYLQ